jgi:diguanylate cyclase
MTAHARPQPEGSGMAATPTFRRAAIAVLAFTLADVVWLRFQLGGEALTQAYSDLTGCVCIGVAVFATTRAWRHSEGWSRRAWGLLVASTAMFAVGEFVWTFYELALRREVPFPSIADVGYLLAYPLAALATISFPTAPLRLTSRIRTLMDALIIAGSLFYVGWAIVLGPLYSAGSGSFVEQAIGLAYPVADILIVAILLFVISRAGRGGRASLMLLAAGLGCLAISDSAFAVLTVHDTYASGAVTDAGWNLGYLLIALAALRPVLIPLRRRHREEGRVEVAIPYVSVGVVLLISGVRWGAGGRIEPVLFLGMIAIVLLVVARLLLTLMDNAALTKSLEAQVAEREELIRRAFHDPLTELANRTLFRDRLEHALDRASRSRRLVGVLYLDIDDFKRINDRFGHSVGDIVLTSLAQRLAAAIRRGDTLARLGGDEFAVVVEDGSPERVAARILEELEVPFDIDGASWIGVSASIGVATTDLSSDPDDLLRLADVAMYAAKHRGKHRYEVYEESMRSIGEPPEVGVVG